VANAHRPNGNSGTAAILTVLIVVAVLYFARNVFIPLALAVLLTFLLAPLVTRLRHLGLGRVPSTVVVVLLTFTLIGTLGMVMAAQLSDLAHKLPEYQQNVHHKIESVRTSGGGLVTRMTRIARNVTDALTPPAAANASNQPPEERPVPVEIRKSPFSPFELVQKILGSLLGIMVTAGIVVVFVIFMLIERENLRDRLIRLAGFRRINLTTKVLDDAARRVSRYLIAQFVVNAGFGVLAGIGLYFLKVPNPFLWAIFAGLLRYIPYLGIWIAAVLPATIALAVDPGWLKVPAVFAIYFGIDICMYNFAEPLLYGSSTGTSPLAILVAAVFWTWLWGPVGLLLATPLTVCVVVIGHHVPDLQFLSVLLSDQEVLPPETRFYQRLLAMDVEEAAEVAEEFLKSQKRLERLFDKVVVPALSLAEQDRHRGKLDDVRQQFIYQNTRMLVEEVTERAEEIAAGNSTKLRVTQKANNAGDARTTTSDSDGKVSVLCIPARDQADELGAFMLSELLKKRTISSKALPAGGLASEALECIQKLQPAVVFVSAVPPFGYMHARYLCRRIRAQFPEVKLVCGVLTEQDPNELREREPAISADELASSLEQASAHVISLIPVRTNPETQIPIAVAS